MSEELFRLKTPLTNSGLIPALRNPESIGIERVKSEVDLESLSSLIDHLLNKNIKGSPPFSVDKNIFVVICAGHNLWLATLCSAQRPVNWFMCVVTLLVT